MGNCETAQAVVILASCYIDLSNSPLRQIISNVTMVGGKDRPILKLRDMEEKHLHNLFLKNMSGLIEEVKNPSPRLNPNSACGGMATHAGLALELGITRKKSLSPQMEAILIWCQCRTREYDNVQIVTSQLHGPMDLPLLPSFTIFSLTPSTTKLFVVTPQQTE